MSDKEDLEGESKWTKLEPFPDQIRYGDITLINDHEFVIAPPCDPPNIYWGIYKYNNRINEWFKFIQYPVEFQTSWQKIVFNRNDYKLYAYDANQQMTTFDIKSNQINIKSDCSVNNVAGHCLVNANDEIHLIGGENNTQHLKWNNKTQSFESIYDFEGKYRTISFSSAVYVKSKNIILLFGGFTNQLTGSVLPNILVYSLDSMSWTPLTSVEGVKLWGIRSTITSDDKHIIICGGVSADDVDVADIWVLDIMDNDGYKLRKSSICAPKTGCHHIERTGGYTDPILVVGYIKQVFKSFNVQVQLMPDYLMDLIATWYSNEEIHWIERNGVDHYAISVKCILSSLNQ